MNELPVPDTTKENWPWISNDKSDLSASVDRESFPSVTVVTPSFNQAGYLEETIRSVLLQGYPNLEYIVIDGGSTDGSVEIIRKYEPWLAYWTSEKDRGQSHAINKGWLRSTGEIVAYLNSDDYYMPGTIKLAVQVLRDSPESAFVYSDGAWINEESSVISIQRSGQMTARDLLMGLTSFGIPQPTVFLRRWAVDSVHGLDESLHMAMDLDLWLKLAIRYPFKYLPGPPLAALRSHADQKTKTRVLEDLSCSLEVFERAIDDPLCPKDVFRSQNRALALLYMRMATAYIQEKHDYAKGLRLYLQALATRPQSVLYTTAFKIAYGLYVKYAPDSVRTKIRANRALARN